jgi:transposase InsO family protein
MEGWLYLAVVMDLYSRKVAGWSLVKNMAVKMVKEALLMAIGRRRGLSLPERLRKTGSDFCLTVRFSLTTTILPADDEEQNLRSWNNGGKDCFQKSL